MTTLTALADEAQNVLSDAGAGEWPQATIEEWVNAAIRDISPHFPRRVTATIATAADDRKYDLPAGIQAILSVEYPTGEDPPLYLSPRSHNSGWFWGLVGFYDHIAHRDETDVDELWISEEPAASETITIVYEGDHNYDLASGGTITVPERYFNILIQFVVWRAWLELLAAEQSSPTNASSLLSSLFGENAQRAKQTYDEMIAMAKESGIIHESAFVHWAPAYIY